MPSSEEDKMSFCKWCSRYTWGSMMAFMFVCDDCVDSVFNFYAEREPSA